MKPSASVVNGSTVSSAGRRLGHEAAKVAIQDTLSRISESGESQVSGGSAKAPPPPPTHTPSVTFVDKARDTCKMVAGNKLAVAGVVFLLTFVVLCALNPPMAQKSSDDYTKAPMRSPQKILVWSSLAAFLALVLPYGSCLVKKS